MVVVAKSHKPIFSITARMEIQTRPPSSIFHLLLSSDSLSLTHFSICKFNNNASSTTISHLYIPTSIPFSNSFLENPRHHLQSRPFAPLRWSGGAPAPLRCSRPHSQASWGPCPYSRSFHQPTWYPSEISFPSLLFSMSVCF